MFSKINLYTYKLLFIIFMYYIFTDYISNKQFNYSKYKLLYHNSNKVNNLNKVNKINSIPKHKCKNKNKNISHQNMKYVINIGGDTSSHSQNIVGSPVM